MTEHLNKQVERVDEAERRISTVEDNCNSMSQAQTRTAAALRAKVEDLEARSPRSNIRVVCTAESLAIDNMELFMERRLIRLLGRETFSDILQWNVLTAHWLSNHPRCNT
ncbi:hypothetical protein NDU88_002980 [Pleurodeles waltl]|uniref:Uncharacterized protein n=1 Tax=Pleurodeles waltl TaxID=8319 RepID=A0AAV7VG76_PLEWA|nr:hypothetical protein NDU88_002980 [Pleurodeles waltl]